MDIAARVIGLMLLVRALAFGQIPEGPELDAAKSLVVMIEGKLGEAPTQGAGIVFAVQGDLVYIATAYHVVRPGEKRATDLKVRFWQKQTESFPADHFDDARSEYDLAVLRVRAPGLQFRLDRLADLTSFKESDKVYAIGYPGGTKRWGVTYSPGTIDDVQTLRLSVQSAYIKAGHSGGALIDDRMRLAGMVLDTDGVTASALRIDLLVSFLRDIRVPVQLTRPSELTSSPAPPRGTRIPPDQIASAAPKLDPAPAPGSSKINPKDGLTYVWIPPGKFMMGCSKADKECDADESPLHKVEITKGYWMGQTEVTQQAYQRVTGGDPSKFKGAKRPVENIPWTDANYYCVKAGLRLPTEAEWEYAARAGSTEARQGKLDAAAWYSANASPQTHDVGGKQANRWNLYDTLGNVWEWVADWYGKDYYRAGEGKDPKGPSAGTERVLRGGSWLNDPGKVRVSDRYGLVPAIRFANVGFRCGGELP